MMTKRQGIQLKLINTVTTIEDLVPTNNLYREIDTMVDFSFIYDEVKHLYSTGGRPGVDPVVIVKYLLIGFLEGLFKI